MVEFSSRSLTLTVAKIKFLQIKPVNNVLKELQNFQEFLLNSKDRRALQNDERTDFVSTNRLRHGWAYQKLANQRRDSASHHPSWLQGWL